MSVTRARPSSGPGCGPSSRPSSPSARRGPPTPSTARRPASPSAPAPRAAASASRTPAMKRASVQAWWGARFIEGGTKAHDEKPRRKKVMRFEAQGTIFAKRVHHPATRAQPFLKPAADRRPREEPDGGRADQALERGRLMPTRVAVPGRRPGRRRPAPDRLQGRHRHRPADLPRPAQAASTRRRPSSTASTRR